MILKECNLDCDCKLEGLCALEVMYGINPNVCKATKDSDLEEMEE